MDKTPIARCEANGVEAHTYPFYVKPPRGMEPAFIFLADHVYNFTTEEKEEIMAHLILIQEEKDLQGLGFQKNEDGVYLLSVL